MREEYKDLLDLQIVAFPQEGILKSEGTYNLMEAAMGMGADVVGGCPYNELSWGDSRRHIDMVFEMAHIFQALHSLSPSICITATRLFSANDEACGFHLLDLNSRSCFGRSMFCISCSM
jgi:hypothetical protein